MKSIDFLKENGVDIDKSLELFADVNTYNDNLGNFLIGIHQNINEIINMLKNNDLANYAVYAHSLKTDAKYFGFMKLAEKALTHEQKAKLGDMYYLSENINDFCFWKFVIALILSIYGFFGLSLILGCVMIYTRDTYISQNTLCTAIFLVCGITFPKEYLPGILQFVGNIIPVTDCLTLMRAAFLGGLTNGRFIYIAMRIFLVGSVYVFTGFPLLKQLEKIALEKMEG